MHIAIPIHSFEPGGVERVALRLARQWQGAGQRVSVVLGRDSGLCRHEAPALDYRTRREPLPTARWETLWMIWCLYRFLRIERVDAVFCPGNTYTIVCVVMRLALGERCPPILAKISNDLDRQDRPHLSPFFRFWAQIQGLFLDHFIALADPMLPPMVEALGIPRDKAGVIADPALDVADCAGSRPPRPKRNDGNYRFVSVGRLVPQKNQALLIDAFARHAGPGDRLVIAGEGPGRRALEDRIRRCGREDSIVLAGHCDDVGALLADADVFVLSSDYEGVPAVIIEALAQGLPIAATDCCASMAWLLQYGSFGVTAPRGDADALGRAMNAARILAPCREAMVRFARQFTIERAAAAYLATLEALVRARRDESYVQALRHVRIWSQLGV